MAAMSVATPSLPESSVPRSGAPLGSHLPAAPNSAPLSNGGEDSRSENKSLGSAPRETATTEEEEDDVAVSVGPAGTGAVVDMDVFGQLLEIDDDETHEFSKTLVYDYISQADATFSEIDDALNALDLDTLSSKGHFLKGSSAALGLQRVQHSCESMQHFGNRRDENGEGSLSEDEALKRCTKLLKRLREEQAEAKEWLEGFYKA